MSKIMQQINKTNAFPPKAQLPEEKTVAVKLSKRTKIDRQAFASDKMKRTSVEIPETIFNALKLHCAKNNVKQVDFIIECIGQELRKQGAFDE